MKILIKIIFLFCIPGILLPSIPSHTPDGNPYHLENGSQLFIPRDKDGLIDPFAYFKPENILTHVDGYIDHVFGFVDLLTEEDFLSQLCDEEAERLIDFVTFIVRFSVPKSRPDLKEKYEAQISELLDLMYEEDDDEEDYELLSNHHYLNYTITPAVCYEKPEFFLCKKKKKKKSWFKKKWHHFKHWVGKNKEPIIAVGVVAGVATVAALTGGLGAGSAAAVGGALIGAATNDDDIPRPINKPGNVYVDNWDKEPSPPPSPHSSANPIRTPSNNPTPLEQSYDLSLEKIEDAKLEIASQTQNIPEIAETTYLEKAKDVTKTVVSNIVHDVFESVSKIGTTWHELNPNSTPEDAQAYKAFVAAQHEKIDEIFGTYCPDYSLESQEYAAAYKAAIIEELGHFPEMQMGELPPPGALISAASRAATIASRAIGAVARSGSAIGTAATVGCILTQPTPPNALSNGASIEQLAEAGKADDRGGLTRAGRGLQKHGGRSDSVFPKPSGNIDQINAQGQEMLENILNSPNNEVIKLPNGNTKIFDPNGRGVHFDREGNFIGFVEKQYE